ncbi:MAG: hypothetical protein JXB48_20340 [Candidatus Latescibacteria bacterium]|nr:hypothetical protein [Candidatus Latescibacterota bacterium]
MMENKIPISYSWQSCICEWGEGSVVILKNEIERQGWKLKQLKDNNHWDSDLEDCTVSNFIGMIRGGILNIDCHGDLKYIDTDGRLKNEHHTLAAYATTKKALSSWAHEPSVKVLYDSTSGLWIARVFTNWYTTKWKKRLDSNKSIVVWSSCYSANNTYGTSVRDSAGGRWRVGYWEACTESENQKTNKELFKSLSGTLHTTKRRTAGEAWNNGTGYSSNTRMKGNPWTTLCPAPMLKNRWFPNNTDAKAGKRMGAGCVLFDTYVKNDISVNKALKRESGAKIFNKRWGGWNYGGGGLWLKSFHISFDYDNMIGSGGKIKVFGEKVRDQEEGKGRGFDANRKAPSSTKANPENINNWLYN